MREGAVIKESNIFANKTLTLNLCKHYIDNHLLR